MRKYFLLLLVVGCSLNLWAQKNTDCYKVTYLKSSNGTVLQDQDAVVVFTNVSETIITSQNIIDGLITFPFEKFFVDRKNNHYIQIAELSESKQIATIDSFAIGKQSFEITNETKKILGYKCRKAKTTINSNAIEVWFTDAMKVKGAPTVLGQDLGLVLELSRNNNFVISASKVEKIKAVPQNLSLQHIQLQPLDLLTYRDLLWKSRFTTIPIFENETINFSDASKSNDSILKFANGTLLLRKVKIPKITAGSQVFVDLTEQSSGDAYDRTGSVFMIPNEGDISFLEGLEKGIEELPVYKNGNGKSYQGMTKTENYSPLIELMRFFTPFGINQYNHIALKGKVWRDKVFYRQDVSELASGLNNQEVWIGTYIGNYDKGGHQISLNVTIHPGEKQTEIEGSVIPIFNTVNVMEMASQEYPTLFEQEKGLEVPFTLPRPMKNVRLRYIATGHGGWENGDEFLPKKHHVKLDGTTVFAFVPWRVDCGSYRLDNPASGNFNNGLSSSDYSRSNWCPGTLTNPIFIDLGDLDAGEHTVQVQIPQGKPEGGSFSFWNVSGVLIGE